LTVGLIAAISKGCGLVFRAADRSRACGFRFCGGLSAGILMWIVAEEGVLHHHEKSASGALNEQAH
jgi:hypothetical protein